MKQIYANGLCVSVFIKDMVWYLVVTGKPYNGECLTYISTREIIDVTPKIFKNS